ncbi:helix-turn-helix domain-containing protein [Allokutzneria sp. A3M-2-11 16]|uniref:helix-turn-helix domain-containing protein n=1 Tax=Allokutzneria sp. A3M-2-11 16 TaxID=2962043 RepID=UPI0020B726D9|nr:helix-turn-helix domain-containing protein [Allokutzneria sp. A3M-2-11 16]MCP3798461.1 helix-turn-helix domain-containing protein [Allokutzneria sp. A3M-2-11 16]
MLEPGGVDSAPARVLIADSKDDGEKYTGILRDVPGLVVGATVFQERNLFDVLDHLRPDLVVLGDGLESSFSLQTLRRLRDPGRHQADIILLLARTNASDVQFGLRHGIVSCVLKPLSPAVLRHRVGSWLEMRARMRALGRRAVSTQPEMDQLLLGSRLVVDMACLPKGLGARSLELVSAVLRDAVHEMSADEVAARCGMSRVSARRYLTHLVRVRLAEYRPQFGVPGRPVHWYSWVS